VPQLIHLDTRISIDPLLAVMVSNYSANPNPKPQSPMTNPITQLNHLAIELIANVNQKPIQQEHIDQLWQVTKQINQEMENLNTCRIEIRKVKSDSID
jgi:hypothetical protein